MNYINNFLLKHNVLGALKKRFSGLFLGDLHRPASETPMVVRLGFGIYLTCHRQMSVA